MKIENRKSASIDKLVSIVVTSYNHAEFLPQRMESLLAQTYSNLEIIVVDDCSTDGSREYMNTYKSHPEVSLFFLESNKGYVHASNYGVSKAKGEYIVFAECDDFSEPDQIQSLYQAITSHSSVDVCFSGSNLRDENGFHLGIDFDEWRPAFQKSCKSDGLISGNQLLKMMLFSNVVRNMSAVMFKKSLFLQIGGLSDKYKLSADMDLWIRMAEVGNFYYLRKPLNNFRSHSTTVRNKMGTSVQLIEMLDIIGYIKSKVHLTVKENIEQRMHLGKIWFHYAIYEFSSFWNTFLKALLKDPLLLPFILLNIPVLGIKKMGRLFIFR